MPLETATYIHDLNAANPAHDDQLSAADSHLRMVKQVLLNQFPNLNAAVTALPADLNAVAANVASLQGQITAEVSNRNAAVTNEANTRNTQDAFFFNDYVTRIAAEASSRATGDTNLQNQLVNFTPFNAFSVNSTPGGVYIQIPRGAAGASPILIQTLTVSLATGNGDIWSYPVPFPNGPFGVYGTSLMGSTVPGSVVSVALLNNNGCRVYLNGPGGPTFPGAVALLAIGW